MPYNRKASLNDTVWFLENTEESILRQAAAVIKEEIRSIKIAVPYYDNSLSALKPVREFFPRAHIRLYLQHGKSTFPENLHKDYYNDINVFETVHAPGNENSHFYHGKVFLLKGVETSYILFGSSNCTMSALTKSKAEEGNVEANLLIRGLPEDFDYYFEQFPVAEGKNPESQIVTYASEEKTNYFFKYGVAEKNLILHIGFLRESNPVFLLQNEKLHWKKVDDEIVIQTDAENVDSIFDITVRYENCEEIIRCWYINRELLELNRISMSGENKLQDAEDFGIGEKFLPDYERLLKEMDSCKADFLNTRQLIAPILNQNGLQENEEEPDPKSEEDFVIHVDLSDEDYAAYSKFKMIETIRGRVISRYLSSPPIFYQALTHQLTEKHEKTEAYIEEEPKRRRATSEEKLFERFVKRCVRGMLDEEFAQMTDINQYFGLIAVVFEILEKYNRKEKVEGIFPDEYVINTRCALLTLFLKKPVLEWENKDKLLEKILAIILDNNLIIQTFDSVEKQGTYDQKNRRLLLSTDNLFSIRETFQNHIKIEPEWVLTEKDQKAMKRAISHMENLFGYKTLNQIQDMLRKNQGKASALVYNNIKKRIWIVVLTDNPGKHQKPDTTIIRAIDRYSLHVNKVKTVVFEFKKQHYKTTDSVIRVQHTIDLERRNWSYFIEDGNNNKKYFSSSFLVW